MIRVRRLPAPTLYALLAGGALLSGALAPHAVTHGAPSSDDLRRYGEALLVPINTQYTSAPVNGGRSPLWKFGHISPGALAIVPGKSNSLDFTLNANWLTPNTGYNLYIDEGTCTSGPAPGTTTGLHRHPVAFNLGVVRSDARGELIASGTLNTAFVPVADWSVYVEPNNPNGPPGYCGDVHAAMGTVTIAPLHGGKVHGVAVMAQRPAANTTSNSQATTITEMIVFAQGFAHQAAHQAALEAGSCSAVPSQVEYPLNDIVTDAHGKGVSGTIVQTDIELVDMNHRLAPLHITLYSTQLQPTACGTLPHNL